MIEQSFCFLDKVGKRKEQRIWQEGIRDWNDFLQRKKVGGIAAEKKKYFDRRITAAKKALQEEDAAYLAKILPQREHWRLYRYFRDDAIFLDIEVDHISGDLLAVSVCDGYHVRIMIRGNISLTAIKEELQRHKLLVSFNGSVFDAPFIAKRYPHIIPKMPHFDLRFACQRIGLKGSLKDIERQLGIERRDIVAKMYSGDPLLLWRKYLATGDNDFLELLAEYNQEDVMNLQKIADYVYEKLEEKHTAAVSLRQRQ